MSSNNHNKKRSAPTSIERPCKRRKRRHSVVQDVDTLIEDVDDECQPEYESKLKKYIQTAEIKEINLKKYKLPTKLDSRKARRHRNSITNDIKGAMDLEIQCNRYSPLEAAIIVDRQIRNLDNICNTRNGSDPPPSITDIFHQPTPNLAKQHDKIQQATKDDRIKYG